MIFLSVLVLVCLRRLHRPVEGRDDVESTSINVNKSIFIRGTDENEIIDIVKTFKSKKSTDLNGLDMAVIKNIIECVITHICNQSLQIRYLQAK